jgi:hypothetical protein
LISTDGLAQIKGSISKLDAKEQKVSQQQALQNERKQFAVQKSKLKTLGVSAAYANNSSCALTAKLRGVYSEYSFTKDDQHYFIFRYVLRRGGQQLTIVSEFTGASAGNMAKARTSFRQALSTLSLEGEKFKGNCSAK